MSVATVPRSAEVEIEFVVDVSEWVDDQLMGWSVEERTRWEGEGGLIPKERTPWWLYEVSR
jgi:hypothetical protein